MPPDEKLPLSEVDLFAPLSEGEIRDLEQRVPDVSLKKGQLFYTPRHGGESLFLLLGGRMRIYRAVGGREQTLSVVRPGTFFGEAAVTALAQGAYAEALADSTVAMMHRAALRRLVANRPDVGMMMIETLIERLNLCESRLEEVSLKETPARLACLFLRMAEDEGVRKDDGHRVLAHYTHELLGTMVGCGRPALTRALHALTVAGAVQVHGRRIHVIDTGALERIAGCG